MQRHDDNQSRMRLRASMLRCPVCSSKNVVQVSDLGDSGHLVWVDWWCRDCEHLTQRRFVLDEVQDVGVRPAGTRPRKRYWRRYWKPRYYADGGSDGEQDDA